MALPHHQGEKTNWNVGSNWEVDSPYGPLKDAPAATKINTAIPVTAHVSVSSMNLLGVWFACLHA